jgi:hypothetical protein
MELYKETARTGLKFYRLDNLFGWVIKRGEVLISNDPTTDPRRGGFPKGLSTQHNTTQHNTTHTMTITIIILSLDFESFVLLVRSSYFQIILWDTAQISKGSKDFFISCYCIFFMEIYRRIEFGWYGWSC